MRFIVYGVTGEYSDTRIWLVRAFGDKAEAEAFAVRLTADGRRIRALGNKRDATGRWKNEWNDTDPEPLDPGVHIDPYGDVPVYYVQPVPEGDEAPLGWREGELP